MIATGTVKEVEVKKAMDMIKCPVPGCKETWEATLPEAVLTRLMDGHSIHVHPLEPAASPSPLPAAKAENMRRPTLTSTLTSEDYKYFRDGLTTKLPPYCSAQTSYFNYLSAATKIYAKTSHEHTVHFRLDLKIVF